MILYVDASALVKRYIAERWSEETIELTTKAEVVATSLVSRAEAGAAFAKGVRTGLLSEQQGRKAQHALAGEWQDIARLPVTEALVARAETLAWEQALRAYDAVQLASALTWQESVGSEILFAAFDRNLLRAAQQLGLPTWPDDLTE